VTGRVQPLDGVSLAGFEPPVTIAVLHRRACSQVPTNPGLYVVMRESRRRPRFLAHGTGGWFQNMDPDYPIAEVDASWVAGAKIVYIGKAAGRHGLQQRLRQLVRFGYGEPIGHRGGRILWQLAGSRSLQVRWRVTSRDMARTLEAQAIAAFKAKYDGRRPFANKQG